MATKRKPIDYDKAANKAAASSVTLDRFANAMAFIEKTQGVGEGDQAESKPAVKKPEDAVKTALIKADESSPIMPSIQKPRVVATEQLAPKEELLAQVESAGLSGRPCTFVRAPIDQVDDNPFNARHIYRAEKVATLAQSMRRDGQLVPGIATRRGGRIILAAAHYRKRAIILNGSKTIDLLVYDDMTDEQLYITSYKENDERNAQTSLDNALAWQNLLDQGVYSSEVAIAEAVGLSKSNVNKTLAILDLAISVRDVIEQDPTRFALSTLYELTLFAKVAGHDQVMTVAQGILDGEVGRKEIQILRTRIVTGKVDRRPVQKNQTSRQYRFFNGSDRVGQIKEWDSGRVVFEMNFESREEQAAWIAEMRTRFNEAEKASKEVYESNPLTS